MSIFRSICLRSIRFNKDGNIWLFIPGSVITVTDEKCKADIRQWMQEAENMNFTKEETIRYIDYQISENW